MSEHFVVLREPLWTENDIEVYDDITEAQAALDQLRESVLDGDEEGDFRIYRITAATPECLMTYKPSVETLYDDDRPLTFEPSINKEVIMRLANHDAVFVFAEDLLSAVKYACDEAFASLTAVRDTPAEGGTEHG